MGIVKLIVMLIIYRNNSVTLRDVSYLSVKSVKFYCSENTDNVIISESYTYIYLAQVMYLQIKCIFSMLT